MSAALFNRNSDLKRLCDEGYQIRVQDGALVMFDVPYVTAKGEVKRGSIISPLSLAGDVTQKPEPHTVHFEGEFPCDAQRSPLRHIAAGNQVPPDLHAVTRHYLSTKPDSNGYTDFYQKMTTYASLIAGPASVVDEAATCGGASASAKAGKAVAVAKIGSARRNGRRIEGRVIGGGLMATWTSPRTKARHPHGIPGGCQSPLRHPAQRVRE